MRRNEADSILTVIIPPNKFNRLANSELSGIKLMCLHHIFNVAQQYSLNMVFDIAYRTGDELNVRQMINKLSEEKQADYWLTCY